MKILISGTQSPLRLSALSAFKDSVPSVPLGNQWLCSANSPIPYSRSPIQNGKASKSVSDKKCGRYCRFSRSKKLNSDNSYIHMFSFSKIAQVTFVANPQLKIASFQNYKRWYLIHLDQKNRLGVTLWIGHCHL